MERGLLFHVNGGARNRIAGSRLKGIGVVAGVSDLIYLRPRGRPLLIEMKLPDGRQSKAQKEWQKAVEAAGYSYVICRDLDFFKDLIVKSTLE